jgi:hypothetical protein
MNHPNANLVNVLTFMWCLWKSRNEQLFNKKQGHPTHIHQMANALTQNLEMANVLQGKNSEKQVTAKKQYLQEQTRSQFQGQSHLPPTGQSINSDLIITGSKIFSDAAWKTKIAPGMPSVADTGVGIHFQIQEQDFKAVMMIQASIHTTSSVLHAEAEALLLAAMIASRLTLQQHTYFTDCSILAAAVAASKSSKFEQVPWEIRKQVAEYRKLVGSSSEIYHIKRDLNSVAHNCAHKALTQSVSMPIYSCTSSAHRDFKCPILLAIQQMQFTGFVIQAVNCL